jgi:hypothetical protein
MRTETKTFTVYSFDELSEEGKEKAISKLYDLNVDHEWWSFTYDDAKEIGLKITGFDIDRNRNATGHFIMSAEDVARAIMRNHGEYCCTTQTAKKYLPNLLNDESEEYEDNAHEFLQDLLEDYAILLQQEYEYLTSEESIKESIRANEYEFTEDGEIYK